MGSRFKSSAATMKRNLNEMNEDTMTEIFCCLTEKEISLSKCVCKKWNGVLSHSFFIRQYTQKEDQISGLFFQQHEELSDFQELPVIHASVQTEDAEMEETVLDFLPEKVSIMSSSNGLLCCRSFIRTFIRSIPSGSSTHEFHDGVENPKIYICNPTTKKYMVINPSTFGTGIHIGLNFEPDNERFQLVAIEGEEVNSLTWKYSVCTFSSDTWRWRILGVDFNWNARIHRNKNVFVNGMFHWLTVNNHVLTFDITREAFGVIELPGPARDGGGFHGVCLGSSEDRLAYVVVHPSEIRVWVLEDHETTKWVMENKLNFIKLYGEHSDVLNPNLLDLFMEQKDNPETQTTGSVLALAYRDSILYVDLNWFMYTYNFKTGELKNRFYTHDMNCEIFQAASIIPYGVNMAAINYLKENRGD